MNIGGRDDLGGVVRGRKCTRYVGSMANPRL